MRKSLCLSRCTWLAGADVTARASVWDSRKSPGLIKKFTAECQQISTECLQSKTVATELSDAP
jgi:hypothetical protein